jgi:hypothetical protein
MANYYWERAWQEHGVNELPATGETVTYSHGQLFFVSDHFPKPGYSGIYRVDATGQISTSISATDTADFDSHLAASPPDFVCITKSSVTKWARDPKVYVPGDLVYLEDQNGYADYSRYYECVHAPSVTQPVFSIWLNYGDVYPINPANERPEQVISGYDNVGYYLWPRGNHNDMNRVPRWPGMQFLDMETATVYCYIDGNGDPLDYGWYPIAKVDQFGSVHVYTDTEVLGYPATLTGKGSLAKPLKILQAIPDYDAAHTYELGNVVHAFFHGDEGIYKWVEENVKVWQEFSVGNGGLKWLRANNPIDVYSGDYFCVYSTGTQYDGIYEANTNLGQPLDITNDYSQLAAAIYDGKVERLTGGGGRCQPWYTNTQYKINDMVYLNGDYSALYVRAFNDTPETVQQTFAINELIKYWRVIARVNDHSGEPPIGSMLGWIWTDEGEDQAYPPSDPKPPPGYVQCHQQSLDKIKYEALYKIIGDRYVRETDGVATFRVPYANNQIIYTGVI